MARKGGRGYGSGEIGSGTHVVRGNVGPEDVIPFLEFTP